MRTDDLVYLSLRKFPFLTHVKVEGTNKRVGGQVFRGIDCVRECCSRASL